MSKLETTHKLCTYIYRDPPPKAKEIKQPNETEGDKKEKNSDEIVPNGIPEPVSFMVYFMQY